MLNSAPFPIPVKFQKEYKIKKKNQDKLEKDIIYN